MTRLWDRPVALLVVLAVTLALYSPTLVFGRIGYDDPWLWADDSPLRHLDASTAHDIFFEFDRHARHPLGSEYLPVRDVSVAIDMAVWGDNEHGPHLTQLILFALVVAGLGRMLVRFRVPPAVAWLGTLLWAAHPIHVQSVAWLSERKGILEALFVVALGHAWIRYRDGRSWRWLVVAALAAIAAVWSKAPGMFAGPAIAVLDLCLLPAARRRWIAIAVVGVATAFAAVPVIALAVEARVIGPAEAGGDRAGRVETSLGAQGHYVESMALARRPSMTYPIVTDGPGPLEIALGVASAGGSLAAAAYCLRRRRGKLATDRSPLPSGSASREGSLALGMLGWAWVWFVPIGHILAPVHIVAADRFALLWSLSACVGVAWLCERLAPTARLAAAGALVVVLGVATIRAEQAWTSSAELFGNAFEVNPRDADVCEWLAMELQLTGHPREAVEVIDRGLAERPDNPHLLTRRARMLDQAGKLQEALASSTRAAASGIGTAMDFHARLLVKAGRTDEALDWAHRAAVRHPELEAYQQLEAMLLLQADRPHDAQRPLVVALWFDPQPIDHLMLADALVRLHRCDEALAQLDAPARIPDLAARAAALRRSATSGACRSNP